MNKRMESIKLMAVLQPLTQSGLLKAEEAKNIVESFKVGNVAPLKKLTLNPTLPTMMQPVIDRVAQFI